MKKEILGIFVFVLACYFFISLVLSSSVSNSVNTIPETYDSVNNISGNQDSGTILGFDNAHEVEMQNAVLKTKGDRVEVTLKEGGKMTFNGNSEIKYGTIDAKDLDLSKDNKFVFEKGVLVSAEFRVKGRDGLPTEYRISGVGFFVPSDSKVVLKDNAVTITPSKNTGKIIQVPFSSDPTSSKDNPLKVNYIAPKDGIEFDDGFNFNIPLKEGTISFLNNHNSEIILLGEKVVLGGGESSVDKLDRKTVLNGIEIKNSDPLVGTSLILGERDSLDSFQKPSINIVSNFQNNPLTACVACEGPGSKYVVGYDFTITPDKSGNSPTVSFGPENPVFPGMTPDQILALQPGSSKLTASVSFDPVSGENREKVISTITTYSDNAKITNGNSNYIVRQGDGRLEWYTDRIGNSNQNNYPVTLNIAQQKGSLTVYPDSIQVEGNSVTLVRTSPELDHNTNLPDYGLNDPDLGIKVKFSTIEVISNSVGKLFGTPAQNKVEDYLYNLFFPKGKGPRPV